MSEPINLHRERQARRPIRGRYRGPSDAINGAQRELHELQLAADHGLFVDSVHVTAATTEVQRILAALADVLHHRETPQTGGPQ